MSPIPQKSASEIPPDAMVLDVRTRAEHESAALDRHHHHIPLDVLDPQTLGAQTGAATDTPIYVLCNSGGRAARAAEMLTAGGYTDVCVIEGGLGGCRSCGLPVRSVAGKTHLSLERQVRILAGSLVLLGAVLGWLVAPVFFVLCALVGGGLVFAGVTDWCGAGLILAKAPWNK